MITERLNIIYVKIDELKPAEYNPRKASDKEVDNLGVWDYIGDNEKRGNKIQKMENMPYLWEKIFC